MLKEAQGKMLENASLFIGGYVSLCNYNGIRQTSQPRGCFCIFEAEFDRSSETQNSKKANQFFLKKMLRAYLFEKNIQEYFRHLLLPSNNYSLCKQYALLGE